MAPQPGQCAQSFRLGIATKGPVGPPMIFRSRTTNAASIVIEQNASSRSAAFSTHCQGCGFKNPLRAGYCNQCGAKLGAGSLPRDDDGRLRLYADIAHPINASCRELIQKRVVAEYEAELVRAREPGYVSRYDAIGDE